MGPILFYLYVNDIGDTGNSKILKFAIIYHRVDSVEGIQSMRADLRNLV